MKPKLKDLAIKWLTVHQESGSRVLAPLEFDRVQSIIQDVRTDIEKHYNWKEFLKELKKCK